MMKGGSWMRKAIAFVFGAVLGGVLGGMTALLLAPYSGEEFRSVINQGIGNIRVEIKEAALQRRAELEEQLQDFISPQ
jgi:gas vesicle protein